MKGKLKYIITIVICFCLTLGMIGAILFTDKNANPSTDNIKDIIPGVSASNGVETGAATASVKEKGGAVYVGGTNSNYVMREGELSGHKNKYGGAVYVAKDGVFTMYGGVIRANEAEYGGAIYVENGGKCYIYGGQITENRSSSAAIFLEDGAELVIGNPGFVNDNISILKQKINFLVDGLIVNSITILDNTYTLQDDDYPLSLDQCCGYFYDEDFSQVVSSRDVSMQNEEISSDGVINIYTKTATVNEFAYELIDNYYNCSLDTSGTKQEIVMPQIYNGLPVKSVSSGSANGETSIVLSAKVETINGSAFSLSSATRINIPSTVKEIKENAFKESNLSGKVIIPSSVETIGQSAFNGCAGIKDLIIKDGVKTFGNNVFSNCSGITSLVVPGTIEDPGTSAFSYCENIKTLVIKEGVTELGANMFSQCRALETISFPDTLEYMGTNAFSNCKKLTKVIIPSNVVTISNSVFTSCSNLTTLGIPLSVKNVGSQIVFNCDKLTTIYCEATAQPAGWNEEWNKDVEEHADVIWGSKTNSIINIYIDGELAESNNVLGTYYELVESDLPLTYEQCCGYFLNETLTQPVENNSVYIGGESVNIYTRTASNLSKFKFSYNTTLEMFEVSTASGANFIGDLVIPMEYNNSRVYLGSEAFYQQELITSVTLPAGITEIPTRAFSDTYSLENINLPEGLKTIGAYALAYSDVRNVILPETLETIGTYAFGEAQFITSIRIPASVKSIGESAFADCTLTYIVVDDENSVYDSRNSCQAIIETATRTLIQGCNNTDLSVLEGEITSIGNRAFEGAFNNRELVVPNSVTSIGYYAFNKSGVKRIDFGTGVTTIGEYAFNNCSNILTLNIPSNVTSIGKDAFAYCYNLVTVNIENGLTSIPEWTFSGCYDLTHVEIPTSVTSIGGNAFYKCERLYSIYIPSSVTTISATTDYYSPFRSSQKSLAIYYGGSAQPTGFGSFWNYYDASTKLVVKYGYTKEQYNEECGPGKVNIYVDGNLEKTVNSYGPIYEIIEEDMPLMYDKCCGYFYDENLTQSTSGLVDLGGEKHINIYTRTASDMFNFKLYVMNDILYLQASNTEVSGELIVPKKYSGMEVHLAPEAFYECENLTAVYLPDGLTTISYAAFYYCQSLTFVSLFDSIETIDNDAFYRCYDLDVQLPNNLKTIGDRAFYRCGSLSSIYIPQTVEFIGEEAFFYCNTVNSIVVDENNEMFASYNANAIVKKEIVDENSTVEILIVTCQNTDLTLLTNIQVINQSAFAGQNHLTSIYIPANVTQIDKDAFQGCTGITSITVDPANTVYDSRNGCNAIIETATNTLVMGFNITNFEALSGITAIGNSAFQDCSGLTDVVLPNGLLTIGNSAFAKCTNLTSIVIPETVTTIEASAFWKCTKLTSVYIPESVTTILAPLFSYAPFYNCSNGLVIYCGAAETPSGWSQYWNHYYLLGKLTVNFGYTLQDYYSAIGA